MSKTIFPPNYVSDPARHLVDIFLAGSIEMGNCPDWQTPLSDDLSAIECVRHVFNPRRPDFDTSATQSINNTYFKDQVTWELSNIENAALVFMYFDPNTKSPISLAELGFLLGLQRDSLNSNGIGQEIVVCCPDGFWRQGNVEIMIEREQEIYRSINGATNLRVRMFRDYDESVRYLKQRIWTAHLGRCNLFQFIPYESSFESQRERNLYQGLRGRPMPKNFKQEKEREAEEKSLAKILK